MNKVDVASDGAIYVANQVLSGTAAFKVYRWEFEGGNPTVAYNATTGLARMGDSFAVTGSGTGTLIASAGNATASNFAVFTTTDGLTYSTNTFTNISGATTTSNDYRLGLTFVDNNTLIGGQSGGTNRITDFTIGGSATVSSTVSLPGQVRLGDYALIGGVPLYAVFDTFTSAVSIYDISNPTTPLLLASETTTRGTLSSNILGAGDVVWGNISGPNATIYALSTNQGIQAFNFTIPEPSALSFLGLSICASLRRRRS
jgi:hypothetical protein